MSADVDLNKKVLSATFVWLISEEENEEEEEEEDCFWLFSLISFNLGTSEEEINCLWRQKEEVEVGEIMKGFVFVGESWGEDCW